MKILKRTQHKNLYLLEAGYIFCKRHNIEYINDDNFANNIFMTPLLDEYTDEYDRICEDLRCFRYYDWYNLEELTVDEYDMCVDYFVK